jgi:hypothetical protein
MRGRERPIKAMQQRGLRDAAPAAWLVHEQFSGLALCHCRPGQGLEHQE